MATTDGQVGIRQRRSRSPPRADPPDPSSQTNEEYYRGVFNWADTDGDGFITLKELNGKGDDKIKFGDSMIEGIDEIAYNTQTKKLEFQEFCEVLNTPTPSFNEILEIEPDVKDDNKLYENEYKCSLSKIGMIVISITELVFFLINKTNDEDSTKYATGPIAQIFVYDPDKRSEFWRFLTYMFVHLSCEHFIVNVLVQLLLGIPLELVHDWWRVLVIYFTGVAAGSLGISITNPTSKMVGASAGACSLVAAHFANVFLNWKDMTLPGVQLALYLMITAVYVGSHIYYKIKYNMAHFAGAVAGWLVGIIVLRNLNWTEKEKVIWWIAFSVYITLMLIGVAWNMFLPNCFPSSS